MFSRVIATVHPSHVLLSLEASLHSSPSFAPGVADIA